VRIPSDELRQIEELYDKGLYLQAYQRGEQHGPIREWSDTESRVLAGRLVYHLGAPRLSLAMRLRTWRAARDHTEARYFAAIAIAERRGPVEAWTFQRDYRPPDDTSDDIRASLLAFRARLLSEFRDFAAAEDCLGRALECAPELPWIRVVRATVLDEQDRYAEALEAAREALSLCPAYPQATVVAAGSLLSMGRDDEALRLLLENGRVTESIAVLWTLASLQLELEDYDGTLESLNRSEELSPLMEKEPAQAIAARRSEVHYRRGELEDAVRFARLAGIPALDMIADRLETASNESKRVLLPVDYVKQHHRTCGPAVLTSISRFWSREAEQVEIAEEICYDGTPAHSERNWAERNGWITREFTVTWDSAVALLDRGMPFSLTTTGPTDGHLQAIVGYDARRGTFLIRDPSARNVGEVLAHEMLDAARATGPRGMVMVPAEHSDRLNGLDLPDAGRWDRAHAVQIALEAHDRPRAHRLYQEMSTQDADHVLTLYVRRALAAYDSDPIGLLGFADAMLQKFPDDVRTQLGKLANLNGLGRENECLELLTDICRKKDCHPVLLQALAGNLVKDARRHHEARDIVRQSYRRGALDAPSLGITGDLEWKSGHFDQALEFYRFSASLDDKNEQVSQGYFQASCHRGRSEEAREFLQGRADRYGSRSPGPLLTLGWAFRQLHQPSKYVECLEEALRLHPGDSEMLLFVAQAFDELGRHDRADELLSRAETRAKRSDWLGVSAGIMSRRGDLQRSLDLGLQLLDADPVNLDGNARVAHLLASLRGPRAAREHLDAVCARFPKSIALHRLRVEWLLDRDRPEAEGAVRTLIEESYVNAWARLQLANLLGERGEFDEAFAEVELASLLDPTDPMSAFVRGHVLKMSGRRDEALTEFREAVRRSVELEAPIQEMFAACGTDAERREALAWLREQILRQLSVGAAPMTYWNYAQQLLDDDELLDSLEQLREARPDHPPSWSATIRQLVAMGKTHSALDLVGRFLQQFPLDIRVCFDVSSLRKLMGNTSGERLALEQTLRLDPGFSPAFRALSDLAQRENRNDEARRFLEEAVTVAPLDAMNHGWLADLLWQQGDREEAVSRLERALTLDPDYEWAWDSLRQWSLELGQLDRVPALARELTSRRPGETRVWLRLARAPGGEEDLEGQLDAMDKALELDPRCLEAHDQRAAILAEAGKYEEAIEACNSDVWAGEPPIALQGRAVSIRAIEGDIPRAVAEMKEILDSNPDYTWGWQQLAIWYRQSNAIDEFLAVTVTLIRLVPDNPVYHSALGDARSLNDDHAGAKAAYARAFELSPDDVAAGCRLFDLQLRFEELEEAARSLNLLRPNVNEATELALRVSLDAVSRNQKESIDGLRAMVASTEVSEERLWSATNEVYSRWPGWAAGVLEEALGEAKTHPMFGEFWVRIYVNDDHWRACRRQIEALDPSREVTRRAMTAFMDALAEGGERRPLLSFVRANEATLREDGSTWASAIWALSQLKQWRAAVRLGLGWRKRKDLEPWMLVDLAFCHRSLGQTEEAFQINLRAQVPSEDGASARHRLWLAVEEAIRGEAGVAETWLSMLPVHLSEAQDRFVAKLTRVVLTAGDERALGEVGGDRGLVSLLIGVRAELPLYRKQPAFRLIHRRAICCIARQRRGLGAIGWYLRTVVR
jgi:tetratricopeptide (TPR) repeat protein